MPSDLGLKPDQDFSHNERLYRRLRPDQVSDDRILGNALEDIKERHPSCSFNRGKYSYPQDVLDPQKPEFSLIGYLVAGNLPSPVPSPQDSTALFSYRLEHLPEENNYSHSEVQVTRPGNPHPKLKNLILRRDLREALADKMLIFDSANPVLGSR